MAWLVHNGTQWYVGYRQGASPKVRYVAAGPKKREALKVRDEIAQRARLAKIGGTVVPEAVVFAKHLEEWLEARRVRPTTKQRDEGVVKKYLTPELGDRLLGDLKPGDFAKLAARLTPHTARRTLAVASAALQSAMEDGLLERNPVRLPPTPRRAHEEISVKLLCAVVGAMPPRWRPFTFFLLTTGLRFGEATAVTWSDLDLDAGKVYVRRQKPSHLYKDEGRGTQPLKTETSHRVVDILPPLRRMLLDLPQHSGTALVFPAERGGYIAYSHFFKAWRETVTDLELQGIKIHTLRHAFGSLLLAWGEPLTSVSAQLGHGSASFTLQTYLHQIKEARKLDRDKTLAQLEAAFRGDFAYALLTPEDGNLEKLVETMGFEPTTSAMRVRRSPN